MPSKRELLDEIESLKRRVIELEKRPFEMIGSAPFAHRETVMKECGCPTGTVCGSMTCPHRPVVTCDPRRYDFQGISHDHGSSTAGHLSLAVINTTGNPLA